jgi:solute carrier family 12 sodium/potassium/chloride transporter 2
MNSRRFGTFEGVFTPTILSILGVIMYLRLGWVVGQVGLSGALIIIIMSNLITLFTGLSISSITTNTKVGAGGAYSIISKSLGLEVGGAIGIPLYISQAVSVAFYVAGFTECWVWVFPGHNLVLVSVITWAVLLTIAYTSARLAFRLQYVVMAVIALSLVSVFLGKSRMEHVAIAWEGTRQVSFWAVFAIFFPAVTGILAGVSMSGELKEPQRSIPIGTLSAILVSFAIYMVLAIWFSYMAAPTELVKNDSIIISLGRWRVLIIAGIVGATLSSALSMFVASPRTLQALARHRMIPFSSALRRTNENGEPGPAILLTALISLVTIALGTLNEIATILTMFFLITYGMLNTSVFMEKGLGLISFRPSFRIPLIFSFVGGAGCFFAMFIINPVFGLITIGAIIVIYILLLRGPKHGNWPDVRKGIFIFLAEQAVKIASSLPYHPKIWKPNLLIPIEEPRDWQGIMEFIKAITYPNGRVAMLKIVDGMPDGKNDADSQARFSAEDAAKEELSLLGAPLKEEGILVSSVVAESAEFLPGAITAMQTIRNSFFPPNALFLKLGLTSDKDEIVRQLIKKAQSYDLGILVFAPHPEAGLGRCQVINFWMRKGSPNTDLAALIALQLERNCDARIRIIHTVSDINEQAAVQHYLSAVVKALRLPKETEVEVFIGRFDDVLSAAPAADLNIFGISQDHDIAWFKSISEKAATSVLFLKDSTHENAVV